MSSQSLFSASVVGCSVASPIPPFLPLLDALEITVRNRKRKEKACQPIDQKGMVRSDQAKPAGKSMLKRLFERQFASVPRISPEERLDSRADLEPSSVSLDRMVRNYMEGESSNRSHPPDDDLAAEATIASADARDAAEAVKLLADASNLMEKTRNCKRKEDSIKAVTAGLRSLGYDASICKSRWKKTSSYQYIDVIVRGGERLLVDMDFRSEFEIARSTKSYREVLQSLPSVFVGAEDRVNQIVAVVSEAARKSLKKRGLHVPPWRRPEYMRAKWLSPYSRSTPSKPKREVIIRSRQSVEG
ncbi:hypothetical protein B296_00052780 [Ensete ventricosum]|uniref:DUF506 domain-containing protein n=1 Tax=Ensete ventricosum TaxID=4639 RepID=A0A426X5S8_ENSVE|nr:hypothetical protein B296_00052780 [Ensete ventricosum]